MRTGLNQPTSWPNGPFYWAPVQQVPQNGQIFIILHFIVLSEVILYNTNSKTDMHYFIHHLDLKKHQKKPALLLMSVLANLCYS